MFVTNKEYLHYTKENTTAQNKKTQTKNEPKTILNKKHKLSQLVSCKYSTFQLLNQFYHDSKTSISYGNKGYLWQIKCFFTDVTF